MIGSITVHSLGVKRPLNASDEVQEQQKEELLIGTFETCTAHDVAHHRKRV